MNAPIKVGDQLRDSRSSQADREAWLARAEHDLAAMRAYLAQLERRWAGIKRELGVNATVAETSVIPANSARQETGA